MKFTLQKFYRFCSALRIDSKEKGLITLAPQNLLGTQRYFIEEVAKGLEEGVHYFVALKGRQQGISTICLALDLFWIFMHRGLGGAFVCHEDSARDMFRSTLDMYMDGLPDEWKIKATSHNRNQLVLENRSRLLYRVAGTKKNSNFGRGSAVTFLHATEMSSWGDPEGMASLEASLAESNPNRLYLWESTARGPNMFQDQWEVATRAKMQRAIFIGWWRNQFYRAEPGSMIHQVYWDGRLTPDERIWVRDVRKLYDYQITDAQIAWWRYQVNEVIKDDVLAQQEHPWCVAGSTRVGTDQGIIRIDQAFVGMNATFGTVTDTHANKKTQLFKLTTRMGYEVIGTHDHPIFHPDGTVTNLIDCNGKVVALQPPSTANEQYSVKWSEGPVRMEVPVTPEFARFIGIFMGDGSFYAKGNSHQGVLSIVFDDKDVDFIRATSRLVQDVFGVEVSSRKGKGKWTEIRVGSVTLFRLFSTLGLVRSDTGRTQRKVHVPEFIWKSPKHVIKEFLSGLFETDGFADRNGNRIVLFSKYREFLQHVQILLLAFGITCRIRSANKKSKRPDGKEFEYIGNELVLRKNECISFSEQIGFLSSRKISRSMIRHNRASGSRPIPMLLEDVVESVVEDGFGPVFNLTVDGLNAFDANGIKTHNTADQAFVLTGSQFFSAKRLSQELRVTKETKPLHYRFLLSQNFEDTDLVESNARLATLKIWAPPVNGAYYAIGADPAWGSSDWADRFAIEVYRCYADGVDQVAEFCTADLSTYQFAWILAYLCGAYGNSMLNLEINGPGQAVLAELKNLKRQAVHTEGKLGAGLMNVISNMQHFLYERQDSIYGMPSAYHWKCLALDTPIPTRDGWTTMGEVKTGDVLFNEAGLPCEVVAAHPVLYGHSCYRVCFDDGTSIVCDDEHIWPLDDGHLVTTSMLGEGMKIAVTKPLSRVGDSDLPIDPYLLGVWLGDGFSRDGRICGSKDDLSEIATVIENRGYTIKSMVKDPRNRTHKISVSGFRALLKKEGLLNNKCIPDEYLRASVGQRLELLRGLMDTDGSISGSRQCSFTTTNPYISRGFSELLRTLGIKVKSCVRNRTLNYKGIDVECSEAYQFNFTAYPDMPVFNLTRKRVQQESESKFLTTRSKCHVITSVDPVETVPVRCIEVDSPSHLYLSGVGMIPTHNTTNDTKELMLNVFKDAFERGILRLTSSELIGEMKNVRRDEGVIGAPGRGKDDRVIASSLAAVAWAKWIQPRLMALKINRASEEQRTGGDSEKNVTTAVQAYLKRLGVTA